MSSVRGEGGPRVALQRRRDVRNMSRGSSGSITVGLTSRFKVSLYQARVNASQSVRKYTVPAVTKHLEISFSFPHGCFEYMHFATLQVGDRNHHGEPVRNVAVPNENQSELTVDV